jgi:hypothetical protein
MMCKLIKVAGSLVFVLAALAIISLSQQKGASVAISPASIDAKIKPASSYTQNFTITNDSDQALRFHCSTNDLWYDEANRRLNGRPGTLPRSASLWIQFTPAEVIVPPHSSKVIQAVITVPPGVTGSFFTVPVFEDLPPAKEQIVPVSDSTASIGVRFRGLIMLTTEQGSEYSVDIMGTNLVPPASSSEMELALDLRNRGSAFVRVRGAFAILNSSGKLAGRGNLDEKRLLPDQRDFVRGKWAGELPPGNYTCVVTLSYDRVGLEPTSLVREIPFVVK